MELVEVDQVAERDAGDAEVVPGRLPEEVGDDGDGLEFDEDFAVDDQIGTEGDFVQQLAVVEDRDGFLAIDAVALLAEFFGERGLVDGLKKSGAEFGVDFEGGVEGGFSDLLYINGLERDEE